MENKPDIKDFLTNQHEIFENVATESLTALFQKKFQIQEPWILSERLRGEFDFIISLGSGNDDYQSLIAIGLSKAALDEIVETDDSTELLDIFGEVGNTYCGLLLDNKPITDYFGFLNQSVPQYANEAMYFPKVWCVNGNVYYENTAIYMGCAMRPVRNLCRPV